MRERLVRGAGLAGAGFVLSRLLTFGGYIAIAGLVSPAAVGQYAAGTVVLGMAMLFAESGMLGAIIHWRDDVEDAASTAFASTVVTGTGLTLFAVAAAPLVGTFFDSRAVGEIAAATAGILFLRSLAIVPEALLQRRFSFLRRIVIDPLGALAFAVTAVVAALNGLGAWSLVIGTYALYVVEVSAAWLFVRWRPRRRNMSMATWKRLAGFARHVVASEIVRRVTTQLDSIVLGRISGVAALGQYTYGLRLATQPATAFVAIAAYVLLPAFARLAEEPERFRRAFVDSFATMQLLVLPVSFVLLPLGDQLALLAFGPRWDGAGQAIKALFLIGVGMSWTSLASEALKAVGRPQVITRIHTVALVASVVLMPSLVAAPDALWPDEVGIGMAVSAASMLSGAYALRHSGAAAGTSLLHLLARLRGPLAASLAALAVGGAVDTLLVAGADARGAAAGSCAAVALTFACAYLLALRLLAREDFARLTGALGSLRRRREAVEA